MRSHVTEVLRVPITFRAADGTIVAHDADLGSMVTWQLGGHA